MQSGNVTTSSVGETQIWSETKKNCWEIKNSLFFITPKYENYTQAVHSKSTIIFTFLLIPNVVSGKHKSSSLSSTF